MTRRVITADPQPSKPVATAAQRKSKCVVPVHPSGIPSELIGLTQWVCWRYETRDGKPTKVPYMPSGACAESDEPRTWSTFEAASAAHAKGGFDGIGFVFAKGGGAVGIDLDNCLDDGRLAAWAEPIVGEFSTYTEVSPSGCGLKMLCHGDLPPNLPGKGTGTRRHTLDGKPLPDGCQIEIYQHGRYFALTGRRWKGTPTGLTERREQAHQLWGRITLKPSKPKKDPASNGNGHGGDDEDILAKLKTGKQADKFSRLWAGDTTQYRDDHSSADQALCNLLAFYAGPDQGRIDLLFRQSGLVRDKWIDREDYRSTTIANAIAGCREFYQWNGHHSNGSKSKGKGRRKDRDEDQSQATKLVAIGVAADLWHSPEGEAYASVLIDKHREHWPVKTKGYRRWLARQFYEAEKTAPGSQAMQDALTVLEGKAMYDGAEHPIFLRLAEHQDAIYLDLCDSDWRAVEISTAGWRIVDAPPVRFRRAKAMLPLPVPERGGCITELRNWVNVTDDDWPLAVSWLVASINPRGPYPILCLHGEQGSAKSTTARFFRSMVDPSTAPIRSEPRDLRDLAIAASNALVVALDNMSHLQVWLSDALCRLSTGGGFATRELFTDQDEVIFDAKRPVILNGIEELAIRGDLLDRVLIVDLPPISKTDRKSEKQLWAEFAEAQPRLFGALLTAACVAMQRLPDVNPSELPRMADFALWATAAEPGLDLRPNSVLKAYSDNQQTANETALQSSPIAIPLVAMLEGTTTVWQGTAAELMVELDGRVEDRIKRLKTWPRNARGLSGALRRIAPNLRTAGFEIAFTRDEAKQRRRLIVLTKN